MSLPDITRATRRMIATVEATKNRTMGGFNWGEWWTICKTRMGGGGYTRERKKLDDEKTLERLFLRVSRSRPGIWIFSCDLVASLFLFFPNFGHWTLAACKENYYRTKYEHVTLRERLPSCWLVAMFSHDWTEDGCAQVSNSRTRRGALFGNYVSLLGTKRAKNLFTFVEVFFLPKLL